MKKSLVIVAGGKGLRMGSELPKQFLLLRGAPIIFHTIAVFQKAFPKLHIVVVLPKDEMARWKVMSYGTPYQKLQIAEGGVNRFESVKSGLKDIDGGLVGIHDAVRPLVSESTIQTTFEAAQKYGAAIPVIPVNSSLRQKKGEQSVAVNRADYCLVQTPQCFHTDLINKAYELDFQEHFTDDATVCEAAGNEVKLVEGNVENLKITTPEDLKIATSYLQ